MPYEIQEQKMKVRISTNKDNFASQWEEQSIQFILWKEYESCNTYKASATFPRDVSKCKPFVDDLMILRKIKNFCFKWQARS